MSLLKRIHKGLKIVVNKTSDLTKIGRIKIDVLGIKKEIEEKFIELGGRVYNLTTKDGNTDCSKNREIIHLIEQIRKLEEELNVYDNEREKIKKRTIKPK